MATRSFAVEIPVNHHGANVRGVYIVTWSGLLNGDDGAPFVFPDKADKSIQVTGTFGAAGNLRFEGSNAQGYIPSLTGGTALIPTYATLNDPQGNVLDVTAAKIEQVLENTNVVRPRVTAGDGTTNLVCVLVCRTAKLNG